MICPLEVFCFYTPLSRHGPSSALPVLPFHLSLLNQKPLPAFADNGMYTSDFERKTKP